MDFFIAISQATGLARYASPFFFPLSFLFSSNRKPRNIQCMKPMPSLAHSHTFGKDSPARPSAAKCAAT